MAQVALYITTILAFWRSLTYQKVSRIELAELEKNPKKNSIDRLRHNVFMFQLMFIFQWFVMSSSSGSHEHFNQMDT